jgi:hypothetical protein
MLTGEHAKNSIFIPCSSAGAVAVSAGVVLSFFPQFGQYREVLQFLPGLLPPVNLLLQRGTLPQQLLRLVAAVPEAGPGNLRLQLRHPLLLGGYVKDTPSAH